MRTKFALFQLCFCLIFVACGPADPAAATAEEEPAAPAQPAPATPPAPTSDGASSPAVYTWVSALNVRDQPATSGAIVATVTPDQVLQPTGKQSDKPEPITLRGRTFHENWLEVTTPDGKTGWVFAGALQPADHGSKAIVQAIRNRTDKCPLVGGPQDPMDGCSCDFYAKINGTNEGVLTASFAGKACVTLDGNTYQLDGYYYNHEYLPESSFPWISLADDKKTLFGEPGPFGDYEEMVQRLTDALLSYDKIPAEIPIENKMTAGMFVREVRDMAADAITNAKKRRAVGERTGGLQMEYSNDRFRVVVTGNSIKNPMQDEGSTYEALLQVEDHNGEVLERVPVQGTCGC